ncbi:MAG: glycoside hydrolase family 2 TIM barrel-domain containing protein [Candidatus Zapsychrus exili]|nr:glycoside hydrolase family 2 TIM barrel-domain containing protein [Candidatus Zapsychrus exili]
MNIKTKIISIFLIAFFLCIASSVHSEEEVVSRDQEISEILQDVYEEELVVSEEAMSSSEFVKLLWEASSKRDLKRVEILVSECLALYGQEAKLLEEQLEGFPTRGEEENYKSLNDVATCLFIRAEFYMNSGKGEEAVKKFQEIIVLYRWAQAWDPRGWYWSVAEKSQASIDVLTGKAQEEADKDQEKVDLILPNIATKGTEDIIDYSKYGKFLNVGKENYHYSIKDLDGLKQALGEGIYPNTRDVYKNPRYKEVKKEGRLNGSHWDFVNTYDLEAAYFKWVAAPDTWGVRLFYLGMVFEKSGMYYEALKAYHSLIIHFPKTIGWTYWQTPWYPAQAAIAKIKYIIRSHPELNVKAKWMKIEVKNGYDNDDKNDTIVTYPGRILPKGIIDRVKDAFNLEERVILKKVIKKVGKGKVRLVQYDNGHWQLLVENKPYVIKGITYVPTKVGQSPDKGTLVNWMEEDSNKNGNIDGPFDSWVDKNKNNEQDEDEPIVGDFQLMKEMGANTLRIYHVPEIPNKELLRKMYKDYGIRVIMGDFIGKYAIGSGASWTEGTDYENLDHKKKMLESVRKMVMEHKDEPYLLMWLLGNENNYGVACNADKKPEAYFKFADEVAKMIKSIDKNHPVAVNNGDTLFLDVFAKNSPNVDIFSANVYRGNYGFGSFWEQVFDASGKPAFITEYGCPAYAPHLTLEEGEEVQAEYHKGNWMDIEENFAGRSTGIGNSLGGVTFEWMDEWWKNYEPYMHDRKSDAVGPFPGGYYFEEWFGLVSQGKGRESPFLRQPRKSYFTYKELWNRNLP